MNRQIKKNQIFNDLRKAIKEYNTGLAIKTVKEVIERGINPMEAIDVMTDAIREIGDAFERGELWLPDLVGASDTMNVAMPLLEEEIKKSGFRRKIDGTVVIGTVFGDIHSIGKTMVAALLVAGGFQVVDLGVNVPAQKFIEEVNSKKADILALSALMTTTIAEQEKIIMELKKVELRNKVKVMVGGAAVTEEFAGAIGADGYEPTAPEAVKLARKLLKEKL